MTSKMPPTVSPALSAASTSAFIFSCTAESTQRSGESRLALTARISFHVALRSSLMCPTCTQWLAISAPNWRSSSFAKAAAATRAAVSLATMEFGVDEVDGDGQGWGQAGNEGEEGLAVRLAGSVEAQHGQLGTSSVAVTWLGVQRCEEKRAR